MGKAMTLVEFAEKISKVPLSNFQKDFLERYEKARKNEEELIVSFPRFSGRKMGLDIIREWEKQQ